MIHSEDGEEGDNNPGCTNSQRQRRGGKRVGTLYKRYRPAWIIGRKQRAENERKEEKGEKRRTQTKGKEIITDMENERVRTKKIRQIAG